MKKTVCSGPKQQDKIFFFKLLCVLHLCAAVWLFILTTVSKGSGLHLLLGLLVTEVTVAMGSWK